MADEDRWKRPGEEEEEEEEEEIGEIVRDAAMVQKRVLSSSIGL